MNGKPTNRSVMPVLFFGVLMGALDIAIVGPALQPIRQYFGAGFRDTTWIFAVYVLMNLVGTTILAKISDIAGRKIVYIASVIIFAIGSLFVAGAPGLWCVILGRAIQGFGAGGIFPAASAVIGDTYPPEKRGSALGLIGAVFGIAFIIGPIIGGLLLMAGWRWIFIINLPIAAVLVFLAARVLPHSERKETGKFDWAGVAVISLMLAGFVYGVNNIDTHQFFHSIGSLNVLPFLVGSLVLLLVVIWIERKAVNPVIPPALFGSRQLVIAHTLSFGAGFAEASLVFIPSLAVAAFAVGSSASSFLLLPCVLAMVFGSPTSGKLLDKIGVKPVILGGTAIMTIGLLLLALFTGHWTIFFVATFLIGFGMSGLLGAPIRYLLLAEAPESNRSSAQGLMTIFGSSGQLISSAIVGAMVSGAGGKTPGYSGAYLAIGIFSALLVLLALWLRNITSGSKEQSLSS